MKQVIVILLSVGLAYLGSVQVARFLYGRYRSAVRLYRELRLFFRERGKGKFVVTIRIPQKELSQEENVLLAELPIDEELQEQTPETEMSEETSPDISEEIHDSPMFQAIKKAAGERVRKLLERVAEEAPKEVQSGNFDYKRFIKT